MNSILDKHVVLVLNRNWQAINVRTPADAICQMVNDVVTALDIGEDQTIVPTRWEDWLRLPVRENHFSIGTAQGPIRVPTVVVLSRFAKVPMKRPKFNARGLWEREGGRCQYTSCKKGTS